MDKKTLAVFCSALAIVWVLRPHIGLAQNKSFAGIVPFVSATGSIGMFDQNDGKIYIYNNNLSEISYQGQLQELGKPFTKQ